MDKRRGKKGNSGILGVLGKRRNVKLLALVLIVVLLALGRYFGVGFGGGQGDGGGDMVPELYNPSGNAESAGNAEGNTGKPQNARREQKMEYPAPLKNTKEILLVREGYTVSYNKDRKVPNWVAWHLTANHTKGRNYRDGMDFYEDVEVPAPRATFEDYHHSKYDRGHMCPTRAGMNLVRMAQACAFVDGRDFVNPDDIQRVFFPVMEHRVFAKDTGNPEASKKILQNILKQISVPK